MTTTSVRVRLFAGPREAVGAREVAVDVPATGATVRDVLDRLAARHPPLERWRGTALVSVNRSYATEATPVAPGDEVAFMPPVSGGRDDDDAASRSGVWDGPLSVDDALAALARDGAGAAVAFVGLVRPTSGARPGARVDRLEFDAYREMADAEIARLVDAARARFGLVDALVRHRVGTLATGEDIVLVAVTAAHRREAFEAAQWLMDALKASVPVWKKEVGPTVNAWVNDEDAAPSGKVRDA